MKTHAPDSRRTFTYLGAAVWLIFLVFPALALASRDPSPLVLALWVVGVIVFAAFYLSAYRLSDGDAQLPPRTSVQITLGMLAGVALMTPGSSVAVVYVVPFFVAIWSFPQTRRTSLIAAPIILAIGTLIPVVVALIAPEQIRNTNLFWLIVPQYFSAVPIFAMSLLEDHEARMRALQRQYEAAAEREAIARDVHDILGHSLTVVAVKAELARRLVTADPDRAVAELDDVLAITRDSLGRVRETVGALRSPQLADQVAAARTALDAADITATLPDARAVAEVPQPQATLFAWCLREAVTNVVRHARATHCEVTLTPRLLVVTDDGIGFEDDDTAEGSGLRGLRARAEEAGATLTITSNENGTRMEVRA